MDFRELVHSRRSTRGFAKKAISKSVIAEVIEDAKRAPSSMNSQPWHVHVLTGAPLDEVRRRNMEEMAAGKPSKRDIFTHGPYEGAHRQRQVDIAKQLFAAMGIARDDKAMRQDWVMRGFRQFDAPVSIVVTYDKALAGGDIPPFDCGGVVNGIVNAAWNRGLGCVINSQGIMQSPVVREEAGIPDDQVIQTCVAMGWPDETFPANAVVSKRKSVDEAATFLGFED